METLRSDANDREGDTVDPDRAADNIVCTTEPVLPHGNLLIVGQVAFSLVALITAALFLRSSQSASEIDPGFDTEHVAIPTARNCSSRTSWSASRRYPGYGVRPGR